MFLFWDFYQKNNSFHRFGLVNKYSVNKKSCSFGQLFCFIPLQLNKFALMEKD